MFPFDVGLPLSLGFSRLAPSVMSQPACLGKFILY